MNRRQFLAASSTAPLASELGFLRPLSWAAAADTRIDGGGVRSSPTIEGLVKLIKTTPRERCIPVFVDQLKAGLSYQDFLSALLLATIEHGDPHQFAGVYSAHRVSSEGRVEERLLPLFWALDRIVSGFQVDRDAMPTRQLEGTLPPASQAAASFQEAMTKFDPSQAERAIIVLAQTRGPRQAMSLFWEHGVRRIGGTFGHQPIMVANTWRTLEALGWQHAEPVLRYLAREFPIPGNTPDRTYGPNRERAQKTVASLPADWSTSEPNRSATLELYATLRQGRSDEACDAICEQLSTGRAKAGALWDAVHLVAADVLVRFKRGGSPIGNSMIHAVTFTNAVRCGFNCSDDDRVRLLLLLQGAGMLGDLFVVRNQKDQEFREMSLLDLQAGDRQASLAEVFEMLPTKTKDPVPAEADAYRKTSDAACQAAFNVLRTPEQWREFQRHARGLLATKATRNPHDLKYPVAAFEDTSLASAAWKPYLLAASMHALHGPASADSLILLEAREALR
jgi:hypothetical protein